MQITDHGELHSDTVQYAKTLGNGVGKYLNPGETLIGFGHGGSESLTVFLQTQDRGTFVRKILSEELVTAQWDPTGQGVMLAPCRKARSQTAFLRSLPDQVRPLFPRVYSLVARDRVLQEGAMKVPCRELIYDMSYIGGVEVSRFVREHAPPPKIVALLYSEILSVLRARVHSQRRRTPQRPTLETSYFRKIEDRLALCSRTAPNTFCARLLQSQSIVLNGQHLHNVSKLLERFRSSARYREILEPPAHSLVVGDTNTENIKIGDPRPILSARDDFDWKCPPFAADDIQLTFLDPRAIGFHENGVDTGADDPMYDNKPWHNSLGNYDCIHGEHFTLTLDTTAEFPSLDVRFHEDHPYVRSYQGIEAHFGDAMDAAWRVKSPDSPLVREDPYWLVRFVFVMGTHFMAMPPFHFSRTPEGTLTDDPNVQRRPLAIFAEGIRWLNLALEMLEGKVTDFHGLPVRLPKYSGDLTEER